MIKMKSEARIKKRYKQLKEILGIQRTTTGPDYNKGWNRGYMCALEDVLIDGKWLYELEILKMLEEG